MSDTFIVRLTPVIPSFWLLMYLSVAGSLQDAGYAVQLEREEIQRAISSCNDFAEAEKRSTSDTGKS